MFYNKNHKALGRYLKKARLMAGLSQVDAAKQLGYCSQFISNAERGLCSLPLGSLKEIVRIYRLESSTIIALLMEQERKCLEKSLI